MTPLPGPGSLRRTRRHIAVFQLVPQSFGWFAYAPLTETAFTPTFGFLDPTHRWAAVVGLASVVVASWAAGYLAGRRAE